MTQPAQKSSHVMLSATTLKETLFQGTEAAPSSEPPGCQGLAHEFNREPTELQHNSGIIASSCVLDPVDKLDVRARMPGIPPTQQSGHVGLTVAIWNASAGKSVCESAPLVLRIVPSEKEGCRPSSMNEACANFRICMPGCRTTC